MKNTMKAAFACAKQIVDKKDVEDYFGNCCYVTPVPGGVGLLTRVTLLKNVMK